MPSDYDKHGMLGDDGAMLTKSFPALDSLGKLCKVQCVFLSQRNAEVNSVHFFGSYNNRVGLQVLPMS